MQLQIECNNTSLANQACVLCNQEFELQEVRIVVCQEGENACGDLCPQCISQGPDWIWQHLLQRTKIQSKIDKIPVPI